MKTKRLILICLLLSVLAGALLSDPLVRFSLYLQGGRFDDAARILSELDASSQYASEAEQALEAYVTRQLNAYYEETKTYAEVESILLTLAGAKLPLDEIDSDLQAIREMEEARVSFDEANARYDQGDYAGAIPLYQQAVSADESVPLRLEQAKVAYKKELLAQVTADMGDSEYEKAEVALLAGQELLGRDEDLSAALDDVRRMAAEQVYAEQLSQAHTLLQEKGPDAAFDYVQELRLQAQDSFELEYMEQLLLHEYEQAICAQAAALRDTGHRDDARACLEEGLTWVDSLQMKMLLSELRGDARFLLGDMDMLHDESGNGRTGLASTVARDQILTDARGNQYSHSFFADMGSVYILLDDGFSLFTGTVAFPQGEKSDIYRASATLQVFGDEVLLAEFANVNSAFSPAPFSLSVESVDVLMLRWICDGANGWRDWGRYATIFDGEFIAKSLLP